MNNLAVLYERLYSCLVRQEEIIDSFLAGGREQLDALSRNCPDAINATACDQEHRAGEMEEAEQLRLDVTGELAAALGAGPDLCLSGVIDSAPEDLKDTFRRLLAEMRRKAGEMREINDVNAALVKRSQQLNDRLAQFLNYGAATTYGHSGEVNNAAKQVSLLNKSV